MSKKTQEKGMVELKKKVIETCRAIYNEGLVGKKTGNVSVRIPNRDQMIITPSQHGHHRSQVEDLLVVDFDGSVVSGKRIPSTENRMHLAIYKARPDVGAIIHTHSVYACALAVNRMSVPPFIDEMVPFLGGSIEIAEYGVPGTQQLAQSVVKALGEKSAALLANHGALATGKNLDRALEGAEIVEHVAKIYVNALSVGKPVLLPDEAAELEQRIYRSTKTAD
jgi:L-fuculose-phosphate aldolase